LKETQRQRSEEQESEGPLISLSWRNRDARPWDYVFGVQHSVHVYGTGTGVLPGTQLNSPEAMQALPRRTASKLRWLQRTRRRWTSEIWDHLRSMRQERFSTVQTVDRQAGLMQRLFQRESRATANLRKFRPELWRA